MHPQPAALLPDVRQRHATSNEVKSGISFWFGSNLLENLHNFDLKQRGLGVTALGSMVNSLLVTVPATALSVYFSALTAYGIHAYDFKLKKPPGALSWR